MNIAAGAKLTKVPLRAVMLSVSNGVRLLSQLAILPVLARLLSPSDYGAIGLVVPLILATNIISEMGLGSALVRGDFASHTLESTVWWVSAALGLTLMAIFTLGAPALRSLLGGTVPLPVFWGLAPVLLLSCLCTVPTARIQRGSQTWVFAFSDLLSSAASALVAFWMAFHGYGVYALVGQQIAIWIAKTTVLATLARFRPSFSLDLGSLRRALSFGLPVTGANLVDYFSRTVDNIVIGRVLGTTSLGFYALAYQVMRIPDAIIAGPLAFTIFPAIDRMENDRPRIATAYLLLVECLLTLSAPVLLGLSATADIVVDVLLGPKWTEAGLLLAILAPAGILQCVVPASYAILMGIGRTHKQMVLSLCLAGLVLTGVVIGLGFGLVAVAVGVLVGTALGSAAIIYATARDIGVSRRALARTALRPIGSGLVMWVVVVGLRYELQHVDRILQFFPALFVGALVYGLLMLTWLAKLLTRLRGIHLAQRMITPEGPATADIL